MKKEHYQLLKVQAIELLNSAIRRYRLVSATENPLQPFQAGQFINLYYQIGQSVTSRPYSLASSPGDVQRGFYDLIIDVTGPFTSKWLETNLGIGDTIYASLPMGDFTLPQSETRPIVAISGGLSITPLLSMIKAIYQNEMNVDVTLLSGWEDARKAVLLEELKQYAQVHHKINVKFFFEHLMNQDEHLGLISKDTLIMEEFDRESIFYCCGPPELYREIMMYIEQVGVPEDQFHFEVPGEIHQLDQHSFPLGTHRVTLLNYLDNHSELVNILNIKNAETNKIEIWSDNRESLLKGIERAGFITKARCRSGHCEQCIVTLVEGEVFIPENRVVMPQKNNKCIKLCSSFALSDVVLDFELQ